MALKKSNSFAFADDANLYFSTSGPFTVHAPQPLSCELGHIVYAGTKWNSRATYGHAPPPDFMRPTPYYLLVYTLEGEADYVDDTGLQTILTKDSLLWAAPGVEQSYGPRPKYRWSEFFIWFDGSVFKMWQEKGILVGDSGHVHLDPMRSWLKEMIHLIVPKADEPTQLPLLRFCQFQSLLMQAILARRVDESSSANDLWCEQATGLLKSSTLTTPTLEEIAEEMQMSYSLFRKRFLELTGKTPGQFRANEVIREACLHLVRSDAPIQDIAYQLGFHDPFHFSKRFKQITGMAPTDFRQQARSVDGQ